MSIYSFELVENAFANACYVSLPRESWSVAVSDLVVKTWALHPRIPMQVGVTGSLGSWASLAHEVRVQTRGAQTASRCLIKV